MNERIRELAEQAGITTNIDTDYFEKDMNKWVDYYSQKFAELLVRECVKAVEDTPLGYGDYRDQILRSMRDSCVESIKYEFGVES